MLSERERRLLAMLERHASAEDPRLARMLAFRGPWWRWRTAGRYMISTPGLVLAAVLGFTGSALQLSSLGLLFIMWAVVGTLVRLVRAQNGGDRPTPDARHPHHAGR